MGNAVSVQGFRHRRNGDGTWDSICLRCYLTAARKLTEQELLAVEAGHECDESSWILKNTAAAESRGVGVAGSSFAGASARWFECSGGDAAPQSDETACGGLASVQAAEQQACRPADASLRALAEASEALH